MSQYVLYGTDHSYFTGKIRPYLRYKRIPYVERQATLWTYQRLIIPRTGVRFIPVLQTPEDEVIQDTTAIIDFLEKRYAQRPVYPAGPKQKLLALLLELYADEWFLLPAMHYRWSYLDRHEDYLMTEFGRIVGAWLPGALQRAAGRVVCKPFRNSLRFLGITPATGPAIERRFEQFLESFEAHLQQHPYLLGTRPCLGDFALAGPLYAHIYKDPYSREILKARGRNTIAWLQRINRRDQAEGEFLAGDAVPETLTPILQHLFAELWPILQDTAARLPEWLAAHPDKQSISRALGWHEFRIDGVSERRLSFPYGQWMQQRALDHYAALAEAERAGVDEWLELCGGVQALRFQVPCRLSRRSNRLVLAD